MVQPGEGGHGIGPMPRVLRQEVTRQVPQHIGDAVRSTGRLPLRRVCRGEHDPREHAHGIEVGRRGHLATTLLRRHVSRGADGDIGLGEAGAVQLQGDPEVGEVGVRPLRPRGREEDIGRLDVAVDDPGGVHRGETVEELPQDIRDEGGRQRAVVLEERSHGSTVDDRHREEDPVVLARPPERRDDVRVLDPDGGLPDEAQERRRIRLTQDLGRHDDVGATVVDPPHRAHAALPDEVDQLVPTGEDLTHG